MFKYRRPEILLGLVIFASLPALARKHKSVGDGEYDRLLAQVQGGDLTIDFTALRLACLRSDHCSAEPDHDLRVSMFQAWNGNDYPKALEAATKILKTSYVSAEAHFISARCYEKTGGTDMARFHQAVAAGLIHSVMASGDGKAQETAYKAISVAEEYTVLQVMGLQRQRQLLLTDKGHSWDQLDATDPKTNQKVTVFFNIDAFFPQLD